MAKQSKAPVHEMTQKASTPTTRPMVPSTLEEMERFMDSVFDSNWMMPLRREFPMWPRAAMPEQRLPRVDVIERDTDILVRAEIPGVEAKDLDVSVTDGSVTIKGESRSETERTEGDYHRCEISRGAFARTVALPATVDTDKASASFRDGMLELTLPKLKQAQRRRVEIK